MLRYDNGRLVDLSNSKHYCPNYPKSQPARTLLSFDELENSIAKMLENAIEVANATSKTTFYDITARPKERQKGAGRVE